MIKIKNNARIKNVKVVKRPKQKFYVEMFDTKSYVTTEEYAFRSLEDAKDFFEECKAGYMDPADKIHLEWILSTFDECGDYVQIESHSYN